MLFFLPLLTMGQVDNIVGVAYFDTPVYSIQNEKYIGNVPIWKSVIIEDVTKKYYIIKYEEGHGYVLPFNIKCKKKQLKELIIFREDTPLAIKPHSKQSNDSVVNNETAKINELQTIDDRYKYEIDHIRYCAGKYAKEMSTGYTFSILGSAISVGGAFIKDKPEIPIAVGAGLGLIGYILIINSNKWMKKISIGPDGLGIKYKF